MGKRSLSLAVVLLILLGGAALWRREQRDRLTGNLTQLILQEGMELEDRRAPRAEHDAMDLHLARTARDLLREGAEPDRPAPIGVDAVHAAIRFEFPRTLEVLLNAGADVSKRSPVGDPPLLNARKSGNQRIIQMIERAGAHE